MYRKIIIALIIIFLFILAGLIVFSHGGGKADTQINFLSNKTLENGDSIEFELKDSKGNALANQDLKITFTSSEGKSQNFTITTDSQGRGTLVVNDESAGNYTINVTYSGDDNHKGCSAKQTITIGYESSYYDTSYSTQYSSYDSSSESYYNNQDNSYYDPNAVVRN